MLETHIDSEFQKGDLSEEEEEVKAMNGARGIGVEGPREVEENGES